MILGSGSRRLRRLGRNDDGLRELIEAVMPGFMPGIHVFLYAAGKTWMAGTSPAMTANGSRRVESPVFRFAQRRLQGDH
jgi:hypothetical protein